MSQKPTLSSLSCYENIYYIYMYVSSTMVMARRRNEKILEKNKLGRFVKNGKRRVICAQLKKR